MKDIPVAPHLLNLTPALRLLGGRHGESRRVVFPLPADASYETVELPSDGTLWSYTIQRFAPKSPPYLGSEPFVPFAVGYVELPGALIVESRLTDVAFDGMHVGMPMELTTVPIRRTADGTNVVTFCVSAPTGAPAVNDVYIVGIGIHPFGRTAERTGLQQGEFAVRAALKDAGLEWSNMEFAFGGSDSAGKADTLVTQLGQTTLPFVNVLNGCATGGAALFGGYGSIRSGAVDLGMIVGFDKHARGAFDARPKDWGLPDWYGETGLMLTTQFFAMKLRRYMDLYGITSTTLARVAEKAFHNGVHAPHAWRRTPVDLETILNAPMINDPLTKYMFCSPGEGGVALVLASAKKARELGRTGVRLKAVSMRSRPPGSFEVFAPSLDLERGTSSTVVASRAAFEMAALGPRDIDVAQLQDTESGAEIMHMAENGFCADGEQEQWIAEGRTRLDGSLPINTDGGCLACGEPIGASGLRQVYENVIQLRGHGEGRQVHRPVRTAYSHVYGAPGVSAVVILQC